MKKIIPHLWFDKEAKEAVEFYVSVFPYSKITNVTTLHNTPSGDCDIVSFALAGQPFMAISAGPLFAFNPSVSFQVKCQTKEEVDALWGRLSENGEILMELDAYPFSEKYGWCADKYGLSWQIMYVGQQEILQKITPFLMFVGDVCGKAEEAADFYTSVFPNGKIDLMDRRPQTDGPDKEGTLLYGRFTILGTEFAVMDSAHKHTFSFNEAISFIVSCDTQEEIDVYWEKLSAVPEAEQCGWLKDTYGVSWQIIPAMMDEVMKEKDEAKIARVTEALLKMKKFDIRQLEQVAEGK